MNKPVIALSVVVVALAALSGCGGPPSEASQQWVARDAWDQGCAEQAAIETWKADNGRWKVKNEVWAVDVTATFKLVNACKSTLPLIGNMLGKEYKQFEAVPFQQTVEMSKCKKDGTAGWALPGKESSRCWTGPTLVGK